MIVEGVMTTVDADGIPNLAPMGPVVNAGLTRFRFRPFQTSRTFANLNTTRCGVFHLIDDVLLIARAAIRTLSELPPTRPAETVPGLVLTDCCRWFEFRVMEIDDSRDRSEIAVEVTADRIGRPHFGFNRAKHAVIEYAILATRVHLLSETKIRQQREWIASAIEKTGGTDEQTAFAELDDYLNRQWAGSGSEGSADLTAGESS